MDNNINFAAVKNNNLLSDPTNTLNHSDSGFKDENLIQLESVDSTNNYAMALLHEGLTYDGMAYLAHQQLAGKGQRGKSWSGEQGENIYLSLILTPKPLELFRQFMLSAAVALGGLDLLAAHAGAECSIKWPNDIYWRDRKAAGILIENVTKGNEWMHAVAGIGINVNQTSFDPSLPNPVSLRLITGDRYPVVELARACCHTIHRRIRQLKTDPQQILFDYNQALYKNGQIVKLKKDNIVFESRIREVTGLGQLITEDAVERHFSVGELQFIV